LFQENIRKQTPQYLKELLTQRKQKTKTTFIYLETCIHCHFLINLTALAVNK